MNKSYSFPDTVCVKLAGGLALALAIAPTAFAESSTATNESSSWQSDPSYMSSLIELARPEVRERKTETIRQSMKLTEAEAEAFWPLHAEYEKEQARLFEERLALIEQFGKNYEAMTDQQAKELAEKSFDLDARRAALKKKYWPRFEKIVSPKKAARFFQLDNQINMAIDLSIVARLPLIQ